MCGSRLMPIVTPASVIRDGLPCRCCDVQRRPAPLLIHRYVDTIDDAIDGSQLHSPGKVGRSWHSDSILCTVDSRLTSTIRSSSNSTRPARVRPKGALSMSPSSPSVWNDGRPETELNFKLYRQATNKIVALSDEAAAFFGEASSPGRRVAATSGRGKE